MLTASARLTSRRSDTLLTDLPEGGQGSRTVSAWWTRRSFRAFGCGGCIITGSVATELAIGRPVEELSALDGAAINRALDDGLPPEQRYCAELAARALQLASDEAAVACRHEE